MFLSAIVPVWLAAVSATDQGSLSATDCSFGEAYVFSTADCRLRIANSSGHAVRVTVTPLVVEDAVAPSSVEIPAHGGVDVSAEVAIGNAPGDAIHMFKVHVEEGSAKDVLAKAVGFGLTAFDEARPRADFKSIDLSSKEAPEPIHLTLESHDAPTFRIERVLSTPPGIDAQISSDEHSLALRIRPDAPWGVIDDYVKIAVDTPHQKEAWISVKAEIHGEISAASNPVWFGVVPSDAERKVLIPLRSKKGSDFRIGNISLRGVEGTTRSLPCEPKEAGCKIVELDISKQQHPGWLRCVVMIDLPDASKSIAVSVWGVLQYPRTVAAQPSPEDGTDKPAEVPSAKDRTPAAIGAVMSAHADQPAAPIAAPPGRGPLLKWSVVNDNGVHGYQIFRSDVESGPFVLLNPRTILASPSSSEVVRRYQWRDEAAERGKTYWYYVGAVNKDGSKRKLSNPQKKVVID